MYDSLRSGSLQVLDDHAVRENTAGLVKSLLDTPHLQAKTGEHLWGAVRGILWTPKNKSVASPAMPLQRHKTAMSLHNSAMPLQPEQLPTPMPTQQEQAAAAATLPPAPTQPLSANGAGAAQDQEQQRPGPSDQADDAPAA